LFNEIHIAEIISTDQVGQISFAKIVQSGFGDLFSEWGRKDVQVSSDDYIGVVLLVRLHIDYSFWDDCRLMNKFTKDVFYDRLKISITKE